MSLEKVHRETEPRAQLRWRRAVPLGMKKLLLVVSFGLSASAFGFFATSPAGAAPAPSSHLTSDHDAGHLMSGHDAGH